jgi:DNA (cytosine-5)-methyltransferase 1
VNTLNVGGFFVGCGGLDFGFQNAGFNLTWANEIENNFGASYSLLTGHDCKVGDFWDVASEIPSVDIIIGGPPCQSFSLVGKRIADDPRGKLVGGFLQLISEKKPRAFLMENVAGLSSSKLNGIPLPEYLAESFKSLGYDVLVKRVDASDYFVPQRRKRLIIMGILKPTKPLELITNKDLAENIFKRTGIRMPIGKISAKAALGDLPKAKVKKGEINKYILEATHPYAQLMRLGNQGEVTLQEMPTMSALDREFIKHIPQGGNYMDIPDSISTTRIMKFKKTGGRTTTYGRLAEDEPAYTINTYFNRPNVGANYHYGEERLITVREALRLQSFPDSFSPVFKNQRELHIQIGNAVPPLLGEALALTLRRSLGE